jgi:hypothetical protein
VSICLLCLSVAVVTIPLAVSATSTALHRWRCQGEGRVIRSFWVAVRTRPVWRSEVLALPLGSIALGVWEVHYFLHCTGPVALICLTLGMVTCAIAIGLTGDLALLTVSGEGGARELWMVAFAVLGPTVPSTVPAFALEAFVAATVGIVDPALLVVFVPVALLWAWQSTAVWGARRAGVDI